jgi:hypothetical protein
MLTCMITFYIQSVCPDHDTRPSMVSAWPDIATFRDMLEIVLS